MAAINIRVINKLNNERYEIEVDDSDKLAKSAEELRIALKLPETTGKGRMQYYFVHNGTRQMPHLSFREAGIKDQDELSFWAEPEAAGFLETRLRNEYLEVVKCFGQHPNVKIKANGSPPKEYHVTYLLKGLVDVVNGETRFAHEHQALLTVPENYPHDKLKVWLKTKAFHPNINQNPCGSGYSVCIGNDHFTHISIADVIARLGNYLQYREMGLTNPYPQQPPIEWVKSKNNNVGPWDNVPFNVG